MRLQSMEFDLNRPVITIELNGGLIYSVAIPFYTDIQVV